MSVNLVHNGCLGLNKGLNKHNLRIYEHMGDKTGEHMLKFIHELCASIDLNS